MSTAVTLTPALSGGSLVCPRRQTLLRCLEPSVPVLGTALSQTHSFFSHFWNAIDALGVSRGMFRPWAGLPELKELFSDERSLDDINHEKITFHTYDGHKLKGIFFPAKRPTTNTIMFTSGRSGSIDDIWTMVKNFQDKSHMAGVDVNVFIFNYRYYGRENDGLTLPKVLGFRPTRTTIKKDALSALRYLVAERRLSPKDIALFGYSAGGAVAIDLAEFCARHGEPVNSLIVAGTFLSTRDAALAVGTSKWLTYLFSNKLLNSGQAIQRVGNIPITFLSAAHDELFDAKHTDQLVHRARKSSGDIEVITLANASHLDILGHCEHGDYISMGRGFYPHCWII